MANSGKRLQISIGFSTLQHVWLEEQATLRGIKKAEFVRRLVDQQMLGDGARRVTVEALGGGRVTVAGAPAEYDQEAAE